MQNVLLLLFGGYLLLNSLQKKAVDQFNYRFTNFKIDTFNGLRLIPSFGIYNSTALPVTIKSAGLSITLNGSTIATFTGQLNQTIKANSWTDTTIPFTIKGISTAMEAAALLNKSQQNKTGWAIKGSISTNLGTYPVNTEMA